jgi:uncharacterized protein YndB with AHSA1/START domain
MTDVSALVAEPIATVFAHLAAPAHLESWLPAVVQAEAGEAWQPGVGAQLALTLRAGGTAVAAMGELVAYVPPWQVAYRLWVGPRVHVLRLTCTAQDGGTRVHVHQGGTTPLAIDLAGLARAVGVSGAADARAALPLLASSDAGARD